MVHQRSGPESDDLPGARCRQDDNRAGLAQDQVRSCLNSALLLTRSALELGDNVGLTAIARGNSLLCASVQRSKAFGRILDSTYTLEAAFKPRFYLALSDLSGQLKTRSLVVIFTDLIDERASAGLIRYNLGLVPRHLPLVVVMSDNEILNVADAVPREERDLYRQGVASEILNRREQLLAKLAAPQG